MTGDQKPVQINTKKDNHDEIKKEIIISEPEKNSSTEKNNTAVTVDRNTEKTVIEEKTESPVSSKVIKKINKKTKKIFTENTGEDDVFTIIERPDPNIDPNMYGNRKTLSIADKNTVKNVYKRLLLTDNELSAENIIKNLDKSILQGLRDILVKKIVLLKKTGRDVRRLQTIAKMTVTRENEMITENNKD